MLSATLTPLERPPGRLLNRACCRGSYLRGAFVAAGSVSAPRRPAHLEIRTAETGSAEALADVAAVERVPMRTANRRGHAIAYLKSRESIRDLLALIGAHDAVLSLEEAEVISATRETANRLTNCDRANLGRVSAAAHRQTRGDRAARPRSARPGAAPGGRAAAGESVLLTGRIGQRAKPPLTKSTVARRMKVLKSLTES